MFVDPAFRHLLERGRVQVMKFLPSTPQWNDQVGFDQDTEVFCNSLARYGEMAAELVEGLAVMAVKLIQQGAPAGIGQGFENVVHWKCNQTVA